MNGHAGWRLLTQIFCPSCTYKYTYRIQTNLGILHFECSSKGVKRVRPDFSPAFEAKPDGARSKREGEGAAKQSRSERGIAARNWWEGRANGSRKNNFAM